MPSSPAKVLVSGASGLVGRALIKQLRRDSYQVYPLVRTREVNHAAIFWDPVAGAIEAKRLEGMDAVVHLAGENIATGKWTTEKKRRLWVSRVEGTRLLAETLDHLSKPPKVLICASALGYYGNRGDQWLDEDAVAGQGFLAEMCTAWEGACDAARKRGIRVVNLRIGIVLTRDGGMLAQVEPIFRKGLGGPLGDGGQFLSWIDLGDLVEMITFILRDETIEGAVNAVAPHPITNREFATTLGRFFKRPAILRVPAWVLCLLYQEMAQEALLASARLSARKITSKGFSFQSPTIDMALNRLFSN